LPFFIGSVGTVSHILASQSIDQGIYWPML